MWALIAVINIIGFIAALFVVAIILSAFAERLRVAYPVVLVVAGLCIGLIPGLPRVDLPPDAVLLFALPPLLYWESITAPEEEFARNKTWILSLSVGLVLVTVAAVAVVAHAYLHLAWPVALLLGALLGPTDELAVTPVAERFQIPRHLISDIEGEALFNDATSLVLYALAIAAIVTGSFHVTDALLSLVFSVLGGFAIGGLTALLLRFLWQIIRTPRLQMALSLSAPFIAYLPAQYLRVSGVLAVVTAGLIINRFTPVVLVPQTRLRAYGFWETLVFGVNATLFMVVGLQLHSVVEHLSSTPWYVLGKYAVVIVATLIIARTFYLFAHGTIAAVLERRKLRDAHWSHFAFSSWAGIRGAVSLAAALAIPTTVANGLFPHRALLIYLAYVVVVFTLVFQGLTLPLLIRWLRIKDDGVDSKEQREAMQAAAAAALRRLGELTRDGSVAASLAVGLERRFAGRIQRYSEGPIDEADGVDDAFVESSEMRELERELLRAERAEIIGMRNRGEIDNVVLQRLTRMFDQESLSIDAIELIDQAALQDHVQLHTDRNTS
ncbi:MAG TPA: Na+/H+ antiporter [Candidatus Tumulicola sp.]